MFSKGYALGACITGLITIIWGVLVLQAPFQFFYTILPPGDGGPTWVELVNLIKCPWMLVSLLAIFLFAPGKKPLLSPVSFVAYFVVTSIYGAMPILITIAQALHFQVNVQAFTPLVSASVVGILHGVAAILFGVFYASINFRLWKKLIAENKS